MLHAAVADALLCTHTHPAAVDGAYIVASAVAMLCKAQQPPESAVPSGAAPQQQTGPLGLGGGGDGEVATPQALLAHTLSRARTPALRAKLQTLSAAYTKVRRRRAQRSAMGRPGHTQSLRVRARVAPGWPGKRTQYPSLLRI